MLLSIFKITFKAIAITLKAIAVIFALWFFYVGGYGLLANEAPEMFIALLLVACNIA